MGVGGLWQILKVVGTEQPLADFCLENAVFRIGDETVVRPLIIGFDASIWLNECQAQFFHRHHAQMGENPELRTLFHRLTRLLKMCIIPVFVFDGPGRPDQKRGKKVSKVPHWLTDRFKDLVNAFGFYSHMAPGEAEAELAHLNQKELIDAVATTDSDTLVFGAKCVLKSVKHTKNMATDMIEVYHAKDIASNVIGLTRGGLLLYALLSGGDYSSGLLGCGPEIALSLARTTLGTRLLDIVSAATTNHDLESYLSVWRNELCIELQFNGQKQLQRCQPAIANHISSYFPNVNIVLQYARPLSFASTMASINRSRWVLKNINVPKLVRLCENLFTWGTTAGIADKFTNIMWSGMVFRTLLQWSVYGIQEDDKVFMSMFQNVRRIPGHHLVEDMEYFSVRVDVRHLTKMLPHYVVGTRKSGKVGNPSISSLKSFVCVKVPSVLIRYHLPHLFVTKSLKCRQSKKSLLSTVNNFIDLTED